MVLLYGPFLIPLQMYRRFFDPAPSCAYLHCPRDVFMNTAVLSCQSLGLPLVSSKVLLTSATSFLCSISFSNTPTLFVLDLFFKHFCTCCARRLTITPNGCCNPALTDTCLLVNTEISLPLPRSLPCRQLHGLCRHSSTRATITFVVHSAGVSFAVLQCRRP